MAVRYRWSCQILYGKSAEFMELQQKKLEVAADRGWVPAKF
jgi:hypothetical protein